MLLIRHDESANHSYTLQVSTSISKVKIGLKSEEVGGGDVFDRRVTLA
jgi:hypothetical protein